MPRFRRTGGASGNGNGPTPQLGFLFDFDYDGPRIKVRSVPAGAPGSYPIPEGNDINYRHRIERLRKYVEDKSGGKVGYLQCSRLRCKRADRRRASAWFRC